jgi:DNA-binding MarR family transcriptional regulator
VHRRLKTLRSKGLIDLLVDSSDSRIKYVVATDQTEKYFATLGQALVQATQPK